MGLFLQKLLNFRRTHIHRCISRRLLHASNLTLCICFLTHRCCNYLTLILGFLIFNFNIYITTNDFNTETQFLSLNIVPFLFFTLGQGEIVLGHTAKSHTSLCIVCLIPWVILIFWQCSSFSATTAFCSLLIING